MMVLRSFPTPNLPTKAWPYNIIYSKTHIQAITARHIPGERRGQLRFPVVDADLESRD